MKELADVDDPAWPVLADLLLECASARVLPVDRVAGERCLYCLQVSARSTLGALALNTGGVTIGHGWLRLLGGGGSGLPDLAGVNGLDETPVPPPPLLLVAFDVLGGRFAINGGGLPGGVGEISYWGADALRWQPIGLGYSDLVHWSMTGGLDAFYADVRWEGWAEETEAAALDEGISVYPPLCARESRPLIATSRRPVPWTELCGFLDQLAAAPEGPVRFQITP